MAKTYKLENILDLKSYMKIAIDEKVEKDADGNYLVNFGYLRVSTDKQADEGYGLDVQEKTVIKCCEAEDLTNLVLFIDDGYTGLKSVYIVNNNKLYGLYDDKHQIVPCICKSIECISDRIGYWVLNYEDEKILFYNLEEIESFFHELNNRNDYNLIM